MRVMLTLLFAASVFMILPLAAYGGGACENPATGTFKTPVIQGAMPEMHSSSVLHRYQIGFRDKADNSCRVEAIKARSSVEALEMAQNKCPTCKVEDLTGRETTTRTPPFYTIPLSVGFCDRSYH